jgi:hypothetical protein
MWKCPRCHTENPDINLRCGGIQCQLQATFSVNRVNSLYPENSLAFEQYHKSILKEKHYHYWISYAGTNEILGNVDYYFKRPITNKLLVQIVKDIKKRFDFKSVVITFFKRVECDCEDS